MWNCAGEPLNSGCCVAITSGGIEFALGGVPSSLGPCLGLAAGSGNDCGKDSTGFEGATLGVGLGPTTEPATEGATDPATDPDPGSGRLFTFGLDAPSSVAALLARLGRSAFGLES